jgi:hypothetical protein
VSAIVDRRELLALLACCGLSVSACAPTRYSLVYDSTSPTFYERVFPPPSRSLGMVLAHWHFFPRSIDNRCAAKDYYALQYLRPGGEGGKYSAVGGYLRDRPQPRGVLSTTKWKILDLESEVRQAIEIGIDAFQFNFDPRLKPGQAPIELEDMFEAVTPHSGNFGVVPCIDCSSQMDESMIAQLSGRLLSLARYPAWKKGRSGKLLLCAFWAENWSPRVFLEIFRVLNSGSVEIEFMPIFLDDLKATPTHLEMADSISVWSGNHLESMQYMTEVALRARARNKAFAMSVWPQDFRPRAGYFVEAFNSSLFRKGWELSRSLNAEYVNLLTWNDFSENSHIRPSVGIGYSFFDLSGYLANWYKLGHPPSITKDTLLYFHRRQFSAGQTSVFLQDQLFSTRYGSKRSDEIEVVSFALAPGKLKIETISSTYAAAIPAGLHSTKVPLAFGQARFR